MPAHHRDKSLPLRLFVACYPPAEQIDELAAIANASDVPGSRVPAAQIHLTLLFLGEINPRQLAQTILSVERAASGIAPFILNPQRILTLPERSPPRLLALQTDLPAALSELHKRVAHRIARPSHRTHRRFVPHFTLKRFDHGSTAHPVDQQVELAPIIISSVRLVSSVQRPTGAAHQTLRTIDLAV